MSIRTSTSRRPPNKTGSSPVSVGTLRRRRSAQARQKGAAPSAFAFDRPSLGEGDAKAKAEGAPRIFRRKDRQEHPVVQTVRLELQRFNVPPEPTGCN